MMGLLWGTCLRAAAVAGNAHAGVLIAAGQAKQGACSYEWSCTVQNTV